MKERNRPEEERAGVTRLRGIAVSPGIAVGEVFVLGAGDPACEAGGIEPGEIDDEVKRFRHSLEKTRAEITKIRTRYRAVIGEELVRIFDAQLMILSDDVVTEGTLDRIRGEKQPAAAAFQAIISEAIVRLSRIENEYLRDRVEDLRDVQRRVLQNLMGTRRRTFAHINRNVILVAEDLTPSETVQLPRSKVKGFVTRLGGRTSHTAIMARSLQIPAVVGVEGIVEAVRNRDRVVVDGSEGIVTVRPGAGLLRKARVEQRRHREITREKLRLRDLPSVTRDGVEIVLRANVDVPEEVPLAVENRARGIGLFRTEFLYFRDVGISREEAQATIYRKVLRRLAPERVVFRTLDVGGDKVLEPVSAAGEPNPMLGWRGIRISLELRDLFRTQIRALLRAATAGNLSILLPMISSVDEVREAKRIVAECREELRIDGVAVPEDVKIGVMIETPAAVHLAPHLAREVDFFSIGTNDLIQYGLAVDRDNVKVAHLFDPFHPAIAIMVRSALAAAREGNVPAAICGEMAGEPLAAILLIGLGARELSVHPYLIPELKRLISLLDSRRAAELARRAGALPTAGQVREEVEEFLHDLELREAQEKECETGKP